MSLQQRWQTLNPVSLALAPVALLFCLLAILRRFAYQIGWLKSVSVSRPVVVVGNITVGGSGKTPLVLWLADALKNSGLRPGLVSRGYGGHATSWPQDVGPDSDPQLVGDEPVLLASRSGCPMVVGPDRVAAAQRLLEEYPEVDIVLSDDGLQHYRLDRAVEIAVIDGNRRLGNHLCLPAGPLREPSWRLGNVDFIVCNGIGRAGEVPMRLNVTRLRRLDGCVEAGDLSVLQGQRVHAVAGIGDPERFFRTLENAGLAVIRHPFPDHHPFTVDDLHFGDGLPVVMTEKDGVKCRPFAASDHWIVEVEAILPTDFAQRVIAASRKR